ncbi:MAG: YkgJ family cysteine cluster protein [Lachnospiraceae bacterium]|nr:YkgJ family cysteine cluster protein [Lachnospiraceae bacterium]
MKRNVDLAEISDGRLYKINDMVKADCHGCRGCYKCCTGMGNSVVLDPYDVYRLQKGLGKEFSGMLAEQWVELNVTGGVILPNLKMIGEEEECAFLNQEGRCSIHAVRPGVCRLFPLGRVYDEKGDFQYFLQRGECEEKVRSKVKVSKWIDTPQQGRNHDFICKWHALVKNLEEEIGGAEDMERAKALNIRMLQIFFMKPYETERDFYGQFEERRADFRG